MVTIIWLKLPTMESATALNLLPSFKYTTLPTYSPTPLNVFNAIACPVKMALNALKKEMF